MLWPENMKEIEDQLNLNFSSLCDWFIDNKLSIHLGEDETNSILFGTNLTLNELNHLWQCQANLSSLLKLPT